MKKRGNNILFIFLYLIMTLIVASIYSKLAIKNLLPSFLYVDIVDGEVRNLINTIWQVQGAVSLLSITLTSLIIGNLEKSIYGQTIKEILFIRKIYNITYWDKVILSLILSIINLLFVSRGDLPATSFIFVINGLLILVIIYETFNLLFNSKKYKSRVKLYIEYKYKRYNESKEMTDTEINKFTIFSKSIFRDNDESINDILQLIFYDVLNLIDRGSIKEVESNLMLLFNLYDKRNDNINKSYMEICNLLDDKIIKIIDKLLEKNRLPYVQEILNKILSSKFKYEYKELLIDKITYKLVDNSITFKEKEQFYENRIHKYFLEAFEENKESLGKDLVGCLEYRYFFNIVNNNYLQYHVKQELVDDFIDFITCFLYMDESEEKYFIYKYSIFTISKELIRKNDIDNFGKLVSKLFINNRLGINTPAFNKVYEIVVTLDIFLYYASFKEEYYIESFRDNVKSMLTLKLHSETKDTYSLKDISQLSKANVWTYFSIIKREMPKCNWEYIPRNVCTEMILEKVIYEFFVFYSVLFIEFGDLNYFNAKLLDINNLNRIMEYFKEEGSLKEKYRESYILFCKWFEKDNNEIYKNDYFFMFLNKLYKKLRLEKVKECLELKEVIDRNIIEVQEKIKNTISSSIFYSKSINNKNSKEYAIELQLLDIEELSGKVVVLGNNREDMILNSFEEIIYEKIMNNVINYNYSYSNENKIENLFKLIHDSKKNLNINSIINKGLIKSGIITYKESNVQIKNLEKFEDNLIDLGTLSKHNDVLYLDKDRIKIKLNLSKLEIRELSDDDVEFYLNSLEREQDFYKISVVNNVNLFFEEEEAKWYIKNKYKFLEVRCNIEIKIKRPCGICAKISRS